MLLKIASQIFISKNLISFYQNINNHIEYTNKQLYKPLITKFKNNYCIEIIIQKRSKKLAD